MLLVQLMPFQLLMIPLYVLIVRDYGLADSHLGMILPFAINSTAVFVFRQFFLQLPRELFEAARIDGAGELAIMLRIVVPLCIPALLTTVLLTFIGPWNEFLWPFLVTKDQDMQPLAVALAHPISKRDITALVRLRDHRLVALSAYPCEELKIGAGPAPIRVEEGWLLIHHGVAGSIAPSHASSGSSATRPGR